MPHHLEYTKNASRFTVDEVSLQDKYLIPKNTSVWFPAEYLHKSKGKPIDTSLGTLSLIAHLALWGDDALVFNPERWMKSKPAPTGSFIPFSHGPSKSIHVATQRPLHFSFRRMHRKRLRRNRGHRCSLVLNQAS